MKDIPLKDRPMIVVDLNTGSWLEKNEAFEKFNLKEVDGRYYGYCPPRGNIDTRKLGATHRKDSVDGVIVVYTEKINAKVNSDRTIIAFSTNATVHPKGLDGQYLGRKIEKNGVVTYITYCVECDASNMCLNDGSWPEFTISVSKDKNIFRGQRFYKGTHPNEDQRILEYIEGIVSRKTLQWRDYQEAIQAAVPSHNDNDAVQPPSCNETERSVVKRSGIAKAALVDADYTCAGDPGHKTFTSKRGVPYMEGHHLIPCTPENAQKYWNRFNRNIDCRANIVCLCPTCHRLIHYGDKAEQESLIKQLFLARHSALKASGLDISLSELLTLYRK